MVRLIALLDRGGVNIPHQELCSKGLNGEEDSISVPAHQLESIGHGYRHIPILETEIGRRSYDRLSLRYWMVHQSDSLITGHLDIPAKNYQEFVLMPGRKLAIPMHLGKYVVKIKYGTIFRKKW